jgi:hypothetical protein
MRILKLRSSKVSEFPISTTTDYATEIGEHHVIDAVEIFKRPNSLFVTQSISPFHQEGSARAPTVTGWRDHHQVVTFTSHSSAPYLNRK